MTEQIHEPLLIDTGSVDHPTPLSQAIIDGYAPGNELFNFSEWPQFTHAELSALLGRDYATIFYAVTSKLLGSAIPTSIQLGIAQDAYSRKKFNFDEQDNNLRFITLPNGVRIAGLSDGPTFAFKDMAMQAIMRWLNYFLEQQQRFSSLLTSSTGDTLPSAEDASGGLPKIELIGLIPWEGVTPFQRAHMVQLARKFGHHLLEVLGDFKKCNELQMAADKVFDLGTVNSVNIARIIAQIAYHFAAYLKTIEARGKQVGDPVDAVVQSGNAGNILSGIIAATKMGLPYRNVIGATNENNTLDLYLRYGILVKKYDTAIHTSSSAQDITMPSNVWRHIGMIFGNDPEKIAAFWQQYDEFGSASIHDFGIDDKSVLRGVTSATVTEAERDFTVRRVFNDSDGQTILDPHTANSVAAVEKLRDELGLDERDVPIVGFETAKPFKFDEPTFRAIGQRAIRPTGFKTLEKRYGKAKLPKVSGEEDLFAYLDGHTHAERKQPSNETVH